VQGILNNETPIQMGKSGALFGILTRASASREIGVLILNAGLLHHVGPFRLHVLLARLLGERGFTTLRIDQSGKGESFSRADKAYARAILEDYDDALAILRHHGVTSTVLVGLCSGADDALHIAVARDSVVGLVMLDGFAPKGPSYYFRHYFQRIGKPGVWLRFFGRWLSSRRPSADRPPVSLALGLRNWKSQPEMLADIGSLLARGTRMLAVFTGGVEDYYNHPRQLSRRFPEFASSGRLQEHFFSDAEHVYVTVGQRERLLLSLGQWFGDSFRIDRPH
jgi:pimeloyl-ACP methyl ester carboxylesterase